MCTTDIFLGVLAVLFPPLPVWVKSGLCSADSLINILLCLLGYLPGLLHAWYIIAKYPDPPYDYEHVAHDHEGGGRVTYVYVREPPAQHHQQQQHQYHGHQYQPQARNDTHHDESQCHRVQDGMNYGTAGGWQQQQQQQQQQHGGAHEYAGEGASNAPPPPYTPLPGDHKIQTRD